MKSIFLGVGSNLGDREKNLDQARQKLEREGIRVCRTSPVYETEALCRFENKRKMPKFLNAVFELETNLMPDQLLEALEGIEKKMGRKQKGNWKPRPIDLDILFYGDQVVESPRLRIPHPEIANRWFVLKPLSDLAPDWMHPISKKTIKELLCNSLSTQPT